MAEEARRRRHPVAESFTVDGVSFAFANKRQPEEKEEEESSKEPHPAKVQRRHSDGGSLADTSRLATPSMPAADMVIILLRLFTTFLRPSFCS